MIVQVWREEHQTKGRMVGHGGRFSYFFQADHPWGGYVSKNRCHRHAVRVADLIRKLHKNFKYDVRKWGPDGSLPPDWRQPKWVEELYARFVENPTLLT
jgi:hypothetical protein